MLTGPHSHHFHSELLPENIQRRKQIPADVSLYCAASDKQQQQKKLNQNDNNINNNNK